MSREPRRTRPTSRGRTTFFGPAILIVAALVAGGTAMPVASASPSPDPSSSSTPSGPVTSTSIPPSAEATPPGSVSAAPPATAAPGPVAGARPLVFAYYYIWYTEASWRRAKTDLPTIGRYDSRDRAVIAQHLAWARQAGIDGLIVSWKHERRLDEALRVLVDEATKAKVKLILLYQGLDFDRLPLEDAVVAGDLVWFLDTYGQAAPFDVFGIPTIVWSGTWGFKESQLERVRTAVGAPDRALLLGSERSAEAYAARATFFDGDAYYWSSPDPLGTPRYQARLDDLAAAIRADTGRWIAPAAPGFDARLVGGTSIIPRRDGSTYEAAWSGALQTEPDVLGIISWNEFSENSHIEPSDGFASDYLDLTGQLTAGLPAMGSPIGPAGRSPGPAPVASPRVGGSPPSPAGPVDSNLWGLVVGASIVVGLAAVGRAVRRRPAA